ncbi:beta-1,3-galactosyltransferase 5-like [Diadema antillarum]|uniref:beta-1,3-galactosyltransferase 5-like n=1 Tax=Diadema antillarum TaxID=105358 RepID=UPI003A85E8AF
MTQVPSVKYSGLCILLVATLLLIVLYARTMNNWIIDRYCDHLACYTSPLRPTSRETCCLQNSSVLIDPGSLVREGGAIKRPVPHAIGGKHSSSPQINPSHNSGAAGQELMEPSKGDYHQEAVDPHEYELKYNPEGICFESDREPNITIVFVVLSAPQNFERRQIIRGTYGNASEWETAGNLGTRAVFLLGSVANASLQEEIDVEFDRHHDIVQEDFVDSYMNLTRKTVMGLKWVTNHCRHAHFVMKIDDDTEINQRRLLESLERLSPYSNFAGGKIRVSPKVVRNIRRKFYISKTFYPKERYPNYLDGPTYLMTTDVAEKVYRVAVTLPLFPWEDVFVGFCLQRAKIHLKSLGRFLLPRLPRGVDPVPKIKKHVAVTNLKPKDMSFVWKMGLFQDATARGNVSKIMS